MLSYRLLANTQLAFFPFFRSRPLYNTVVAARQRGLFFWAWILPHGIPEITQIVIAGAAGLVIARGLLLPRRRARATALAVIERTSA